jgi:hypothetical protein
MQARKADGTREDRTGWRCQAISQRHRTWGYDCPAVDLDFMVAEYNYGKPVALIEYKDKHARNPDLNHATYKALKSLADGYTEPLPFLVAIYCPDDWWFRIIPVNARAIYIYKNRSLLTEQRFVRSLYSLRKKVLTEQDEIAIRKLSNIPPPDASFSVVD